VGRKSVGGYQFVTYKGDHPPFHVHIFRDDRLIGRWDIENQTPMSGARFGRPLLKALTQAGYRLEEADK